MNDLTIIGTTIRQDDQGRYCLNDLHKAAGGIPHHRPSKWMTNKQAQALISEMGSEPEFGLGSGSTQSPNSGLGRAPLNVIHGGDWNGTYVVKELVYAYAMWISPAFHLKVIRAYDALVTGEIAARDGRIGIHERAYFKRHPKRSLIRLLALKGEPYWYIALAVQCSASTVGKAIRDMIEWGLMEANRLLAARTGMRAWWAFRRKHVNQLEMRF